MLIAIRKEVTIRKRRESILKKLNEAKEVEFQSLGNNSTIL